MPSSLFFPLENIKPSEILSQYSEWIYFTLILVFFISISGIALRKHFEKPYVKPLIISVGLILTFSVFRYKNYLTVIFEGWGILGTILLVIMAGTIPYGLCRGFGLSAIKAFSLSYILLYILSWVKFPYFYHAIGEQNLGLINLGLLVLFAVSIFKLVKFRKIPSIMPSNFTDHSPLQPEIDNDIQTEDKEKDVIRNRAEKLTKIEFRNIKDIGKAIDEIKGIIEKNRNILPKEEKKRISNILNQISKEEEIFKKSINKLQKLFLRLNSVDAQHFKRLKDRGEKASGKEKKLIMAEIEDEEEKIKIERDIFQFNRKLDQYLKPFNEQILAAMNCIKNSPYPFDAMKHLEQAGKMLDDLWAIIKEIMLSEEKVVKLIKTEKKLLNKEKETI